MLAARAPWRPWLAFAAAVLVPAAAMAAVAVRATRSEEAAIQRETARTLEASAQRAASEIERRASEAAGALANARLEGDPAAVAADVARLAPPFADAVVLAEGGAVLHPAARTRTA